MSVENQPSNIRISLSVDEWEELKRERDEAIEATKRMRPVVDAALAYWQAAQHAKLGEEAPLNPLMAATGNYWKRLVELPTPEEKSQS